MNDQTAFGVLLAIDEAGLKAGQDIAVAGFVGLQASRYSYPPLTTLEQPIYDIARQLVRLLSAKVFNRGMPVTRIIYQPTLLIHAHTGNHM